MDRRMGWVKKSFKATLNYMKISYKSLWLVIILCSAYSWIMVYSANYRMIEDSRAIYVQLIAIGIGMLGSVLISMMDYERLGELWWLVTIGCVVLMLLTFTALGGGAARGESQIADDRAWIYIAGVSFQPSELMKIGFLITFSYHLSYVIKAGQLNNIRQLIMLIGHIALPVGLIMAQNDDGTALMFLVMALFILFGSGLNWKYIASGIGLVIAALPLLWQFLSSDQKNRFSAVYNPKPEDIQGSLYQQYNGRMALGSGGIWGQGWCKGQMVQSGKVPEASNDFIFTVAGEEFGFVGCMVILLLLLAIMVMCIKTALRARDDMGRFICIGFFGLIAAQTMFNVGMCLVVLPVIGIPLPFFSAGGSSSMCLYFGVGLVMSVFIRRDETRMRINA